MLKNSRVKMYIYMPYENLRERERERERERGVVS
jgi:hypothetical protein